MPDSFFDGGGGEQLVVTVIDEEVNGSWEIFEISCTKAMMPGGVLKDTNESQKTINTTLISRG